MLILGLGTFLKFADVLVVTHVLRFLPGEGGLLHVGLASVAHRLR